MFTAINMGIEHDEDMNTDWDGQYYDNARTTRLKSDKDSVGGCSQVSVVVFLVLLHARLW